MSHSTCLNDLTHEAHGAGIKVHAWLVDFAEGVNGAAFREHPEWAVLQPGRRDHNPETLGPRRRPYPYVWMCPAHRPGYTDQWLLPMIEEIAAYPRRRYPSRLRSLSRRRRARQFLLLRLSA